MSGILHRFSNSGKKVGEAASPSVDKKPPASVPPLVKQDSTEESTPYRPKLSEFVALLQHETQQVIEHLARSDFHQVLTQSPSASFVKIERIQLEIPVKSVVETINASETKKIEEMVGARKLSNLNKTFLLHDGTSLSLRVQVLGTQTADTTQAEGKLKLEFSIAAK
jgi:hypothetical protein